jgi:NAD(P)-dependent dehydrogenase (short-subunit alcohol dehydrogenase family)
VTSKSPPLLIAKMFPFGVLPVMDGGGIEIPVLSFSGLLPASEWPKEAFERLLDLDGEKARAAIWGLTREMQSRLVQMGLKVNRVAPPLGGTPPRDVCVLVGETSRVRWAIQTAANWSVWPMRADETLLRALETSRASWREHI